MYVAVRRFEGVTDSQKVAQMVEEDYVPIISQMPGSWLTTVSTPETA
jgi:hypothetical protein